MSFLFSFPILLHIFQTIIYYYHTHYVCYSEYLDEILNMEIQVKWVHIYKNNLWNINVLYAAVSALL